VVAAFVESKPKAAAQAEPEPVEAEVGLEKAA
jgi:hypothetical protein